MTNAHHEPFAPRPLVLIIALAGAIAGTFCAPSSPPTIAAGAEANVVASERAAPSAVPVAMPASSGSLQAASAAPPPAASSSAPVPLPVPKVSAPAKPKPVEPAHGRESWAVFLVLGPKTPEREALAEAWWAAQKALSRGFGCHEGAGAPGSEEMYVAAYFKTEKDAKAFAAGSSPPPVRIAKLKTYCLD